MLSRELDARQAGIDDRGGDEQENALEDQAVEAEGDQVENDDRQRTQHHRRGNGDEERAGAVPAGGIAHRFGDHDAHRGGGEENDDEGEKSGDAADDPHQQAGKEGHDRGGDEPQDKIDPLGGLEDLLLAAHAFPAAVAGGGAHGAFNADQLPAFVAAQGGLHGGVVGAVGGSSGIDRLGNHRFDYLGKTYGRVLVHVGGEVAVEVAGVAEAHEAGGIIPGAHLHLVVVGETDGDLPVHAEHGLAVIAQGDGDGGAFGKDHRPVHGEVRGDGHEQDVAQLRGQDGTPGGEGVGGGPGGGGGDQIRRPRSW